MIPFPNKKYQIIYVDPPWPIRWRGSSSMGKRPLQYPTMTITELASLPVKNIAEDLSKLFMWTTNGFLPEALGLLKFWGFQYDKLWTWCKPTGAGGHPRNATEHLIEARELIEYCYPNYTKIELFARPPKDRLFEDESYKGWDVWGNEV